jgi:hypothetical protein
MESQSEKTTYPQNEKTNKKLIDVEKFTSFVGMN